MTESDSSPACILRSASCLGFGGPGLCGRGAVEASQVPMSDVRTCLEVSDTAEPARPSPGGGTTALDGTPGVAFDEEQGLGTPN